MPRTFEHCFAGSSKVGCRIKGYVHIHARRRNMVTAVHPMADRLGSPRHAEPGWESRKWPLGGGRDRDVVQVPRGSNAWCDSVVAETWRPVPETVEIKAGVCPERVRCVRFRATVHRIPSPRARKDRSSRQQLGGGSVQGDDPFADAAGTDRRDRFGQSRCRDRRRRQGASRERVLAGGLWIRRRVGRSSIAGVATGVAGEKAGNGVSQMTFQWRRRREAVVSRPCGLLSDDVLERLEDPEKPLALRIRLGTVRHDLDRLGNAGFRRRRLVQGRELVAQDDEGGGEEKVPGTSAGKRRRTRERQAGLTWQRGRAGEGSAPHTPCAPWRCCGTRPRRIPPRISPCVTWGVGRTPGRPNDPLGRRGENAAA